MKYIVTYEVRKGDNWQVEKDICRSMNGLIVSLNMLNEEEYHLISVVEE